ncbi:MAG: NADH-quinone oxidoreductase subunit J [Planctomycetes bacterium]|nr:NADH-quinone oxidoreductase subunit J [Planctomycetota bacterium]
MDDLQPLLFWIIALMMGTCAVATVVTQNIVRAATWLLFTLAGTSGMFFLLGADLVGTIQLLVYVGGTLVLVVFGVMLTAQGPFINMKTSGAEWAISAVVGILLLSVLVIGTSKIGHVGPPEKSAAARFQPTYTLASQREVRDRLELERGRGSIDEDQYYLAIARLDKEQVAQASYSAVIGRGFIGEPVGPVHEETVGKSNKTILVRAHYLLPFEIVSIHLLVVLIGAAYLARAKRRRRVAA